MNKSNEFEKKAKTYLDDSLDELSPDVSRRLQHARYAAIEKAQSCTFWSFAPQAATAVFAIAVISISLNLNFNQNELDDAVFTIETEIEMLTSNENLELMEDLEFLEWLAESEVHAS